MHLANERIALKAVTTTFPDTIWVKKFDFFPEMTFGAGKVCQEVYALFDDSTKALCWKLSDGAEIVFVLGCNNVAWRRTEIAPPVATIVPAPVVAKTTWDNRSRDSVLKGLGILFFVGLFIAFLVWLIRQIIRATPLNPPTAAPVTSTAPTPPTPPMTEEEFNSALQQHDENIRSMERISQDIRGTRRELIDERLRQLDAATLATEAERRRVRNLGSQQ